MVSFSFHPAPSLHPCLRFLHLVTPWTVLSGGIPTQRSDSEDVQLGRLPSVQSEGGECLRTCPYCPHCPVSSSHSGLSGRVVWSSAGQYRLGLSPSALDPSDTPRSRWTVDGHWPQNASRGD